MMRDEDFTRKFWKRVDYCLLKENLSIGDLCEGSDIPYKTLTGWRTKHRLPDVVSLVSIAKSLDCTSDYLLDIQAKDFAQAVEIYEYMQTEMPSLLEDITRKISLKKGSGFSGKSSNLKEA